MDAVNLLSEIIAQRTPVPAARYRSAPAFQLLTESGFIKEAGVVQSTYCDECETPHDAEVVFEQGSYGFYCPDLGFISKQRDDFAATTGDTGRLVEDLADNLNCKRCKTTPVLGQTWRVGVVSSPRADVVVYFQPTMRDATDVRSFEAAFARETNAQFGVILTADGSLAYPPFSTINLEDCLHFNISGRSFEFEADLFQVAGAPDERKGGRPSPYEAKLKAIIAERLAKGQTLPGQNEEARKLRAEYSAKYGGDVAPSITTIKRVMTKT